MDQTDANDVILLVEGEHFYISENGVEVAITPAGMERLKPLGSEPVRVHLDVCRPFMWVRKDQP